MIPLGSEIEYYLETVIFYKDNIFNQWVPDILLIKECLFKTYTDSLKHILTYGGSTYKFGAL